MGRCRQKKTVETDFTKTSQRFYNYLSSVLILTSIYFFNYISRIIIAPLTTVIEKDLGITHTESGTLFLVVSTGAFITLLGSGIVSSIISHRWTILLSSFLLSLALFNTAFMDSLWGIRIGLLFLGMAAGLYFPSGVAVLTSLVNPQYWGVAIAIHDLAPNLSFVAAPVFAELILISYDRQAVFIILGCFCIMFTLMYYFFDSGGNFKGAHPKLFYIKTLLLSRSMWFIIFILSLSLVSIIGIYNILPLFLVIERGMDRQWANTLLSISRIFCIPMTFFGGWASDRFGPNLILTVVLLLTGLTTILLAIVPRSLLPIFVCLQTIFAACLASPGMAALASMSLIETRSIVVSLAASIAFFIGSGVGPWLIA